MVLAHTHDEVEDGDESADGVWIAPEHDVGKADVVVCRDVAGRYTGERGLHDRKRFELQ